MSRSALRYGVLCIGLAIFTTGTGCVSISVRVTTSTPTDVDTYLSHVAILADDGLGGRGTGSKGIDIAAGYIAGQFAAAGVAPGGSDGTYFQNFTARTQVTLLDATFLNISGAATTATLKDDFIPFGFSAAGEFSGDVVFAGYGITNADKNHDDYAGIDVKGRVVLVLRREPPGWNDDGSYSDHAKFDSKIELASAHGAVAMLVVNQDPGADGIDGLMRFRSGGVDFGLPAMHIKRTLADSLLAAAKLPTLNELQTSLDGSTTSESALLVGVTISGEVAYDADPLLAQNVIGLIPGDGPHANEYIVIGAHYDHLGTTRGEIYNGADDNASGTAGVIELAKSLASANYLDRSVLLMTFSGEEMGLLGSQHYVKHPTVDIDSIAAMINMDMIGRLSDEHANMLAIQGLGTGDAFKRIVERRANQLDLDFLPDDSAKGPSDHMSFYEADVPALFFFTGVHSDYHQPGDDTDKVNAEGAVRIVELVRNIAVDLANRTDAPQFAEVEKRADIFRGQRPSRQGSAVVMGIMPDMEDESDAPGWRVAEVLSGGGAAKAGMISGDRIVKIDATVIAGFGDYRDATRDKKPGDEIAVTVLRGTDEVTLSIVLSARGG